MVSVMIGTKSPANIDRLTAVQKIRGMSLSILLDIIKLKVSITSAFTLVSYDG